MNLRKKLLKFWNFWPPFLFSGIRIKSISEDSRDVIVQLKLHFWNANYVGTQYGGSMFSMTDAFYMVMLLKNLGPNYIVWDKSATIEYIKPGKTTLTAEFKLTEDEILTIKEKLETEHSIDLVKIIEITDTNLVVVAKVTKTLYIKKKLRESVRIDESKDLRSTSPGYHQDR